MPSPFEELLVQIYPNEAVYIDIQEKLRQIKNGKQNDNLKRQMQKVPPLLRRDKSNQQAYDPLVVSLGPYHHGKEELQLAEDFKLTALQMFVDGSQNAQFFRSEVLERVNDARNCYPENSTEKYDDATFARMMLLDACFIINYIVLRAKPDKHKYYVTRNHLGELLFATILHDLFLLENQIPFWMVVSLMRSRYGKEEGEEMIHKFLTRHVWGESTKSSVGVAERSDEELPLHLLDAFRQVAVSESPEDKRITQKLSTGNGDSQSGCLKHMGNLVKCSKFRQYLPYWPTKGDDEDNSTKKYVQCFRSATDLKAKGIHFRPSTAHSLKGIKFKSRYFYALLEVPTWVVSIYTKVLFVNMIAYEMCPSIYTRREVTTYIEFMKSLIDSPKDVKELREKKILFTTLGSDEEVVKVYKEIYTYGVYNSSIFQQEKKKIEKHYNSKAKTWLAELFYTYFRSPWTALALFAATFLLVLTFLQTYYTVRPS